MKGSEGGESSVENDTHCFPSPKNSNLTCASAAAPEARNARFEVLGVRLEAGVGSGKVLEVALELCCCCSRGRRLGASSVELGLQLAAAGLQVRRGRSVGQGWCSSSSSRRDACLLQLAGDCFLMARKKRKLRGKKKGERGGRREAAPLTVKA